MSNAALFADISNLYYCIGKRYTGRKLNYQALYAKAASFGNLARATAYGTQVQDEATNFIRCLERLGYDTKYKRPKLATGDEVKVVRKADWKVGISMDVVRASSRLNTVILASTDPDMMELFVWLRDAGIRIIIIGCGIPRDLQEIADRCVEISEDMLELQRSSIQLSSAQAA